MAKFVFDTETDGLMQTVSKVHCIVAKDADSGEVFKAYTESNLRGLGDVLRGADLLIGHNIVKYDIPVLKKLLSDLSDVPVYDTLIMSRLAHPDIVDNDGREFKHIPKHLKGKYSLEAWGHRLRCLKGDYGKGEDSVWAEFNPAMLEYCEQDVNVTMALYEYLSKFDYSEKAVWLEHQFAKIISMQEIRGVRFDYEKAQELAQTLLEAKAPMMSELKKVFPDRVVRTEVGHFTPKRNGKTPSGFRYFGGAPYCRVEHVEFNHKSYIQRAERLQEIGWVPLSFSEKSKLHPKGYPKTDMEALEQALELFPQIRPMLNVLMLDKRLSQLWQSNSGNALLQRAIPSNGYYVIHGSVDTTGTVTYRCSHSHPNLAQVPKVLKDKEGNILYGADGLYGFEFRSLFLPREGYSLVGFDAASLELRCEAQFLYPYDNGRFAKIVVEGDPHEENRAILSLDSRDRAKPFIYGFNYGASARLLAIMAGKNPEEGKDLKAMFIEKFIGLRELIRELTRLAKEDNLVGIDERRLKVRFAYRTLNTMLQSAGAIIMKAVLVFLYEELCGLGWTFGDEYAFVLNIHDEVQAEVRIGLEDTYKEAVKRATERTNSWLNLKCPMEMDVKVGRTWAETH